MMTTRVSKLLLQIFLYTFATSTFGGGWHSSGGPGPSTARNPWFLGKKPVTYCFIIDTEHFGVSLATSKKRFLEAIAYWKQELKNPNVLGKKWAQFDEVDVGEATFIESEACNESSFNESVDLKIQLGTLTEDQIQRIPNPRDFGALTMRTSYDSQYLQAKGFMYISPESGPLQVDFKRSRNSYLSFDEHAKDGLGLKFIMIHELGHIFGFANTYAGEIDFMSENFVKRVMGAYGRPFPKSTYENPPKYFVGYDSELIRKLPQSLSRCQQVNRDTFEKFFEYDSRLVSPCISLEKSTESVEPHVYKVKFFRSRRKQVGVITLQSAIRSSKKKSVIALYLPKNQQVLEDTINQTNVNVRLDQEIIVQGVYTPQDQPTNQKPVHLTWNGRTLRLIGYEPNESSLKNLLDFSIWFDLDNDAL